MGRAATVIAIGGHQGLTVYRTPEGIRKVVEGDVLREENLAGLHNEARLLRVLSGMRIAPALFDEAPTWILEEDLQRPSLQQLVETGALVQNGERFRRNCTKLLAMMRKARVRHGDLTAPNIIIDAEDRPIAVDWQQSHLYDEPMQDKHHFSDSYLLWRAAVQVGSVSEPTPDTPRVIRRWLMVLADLGGTVGITEVEGRRLLDLGCFQGDFCGMAAAEGMIATGVDQGGFNPEVDSIEVARELWPDCTFVRANITELSDYSADAVLLFSTWVYVLRDHGRAVADALIANIVRQTDRLYFETQLFGDGPGADFHQTDADVRNYLAQFGRVEALGSVPVTGRNAYRTVWRLSK